MNFYSVPEGISSAELYDVLQDSKGFIWLSMKDKLNRFDGYTFVNLETTNKNLTSQHYIINDLSVLYQLSQKHFIAKYINGVGIFDLINSDDLTVTSFDLKVEFPASEVLEFVPVPGSDIVAVLCKENMQLVLYWFDPIHHTKELKCTFSLKSYPVSNKFLNIKIDIAQSQLVYISIADLPIICMNLALKNTEVLPISISKSGYHILKAVNGQYIYLVDQQQSELLKYNADKKTIETVHITKLKGKIEYLWNDLDGNIIIGNTLNSRYFNELILLPYASSNSISLDFIVKTENKISQVRGDHFLKEILLTTFSGFYIFYNENKRFKSALSQKLVRQEWGNIIRGMKEDGKGHLYIAEEGNSIYKLDLSNDSILKSYKNSQDKFAVVGCLQMIDQNLWGIRYKTRENRALYRLNTKNEIFSYWSLPFQWYKIKDFTIIDTSKLLFFGFDEKMDTLATWQFDFSSEKWSPYQFKSNEKKLIIQIVLKDSMNKIWIGTTNGLYLASLDQRTIEKISFGPPNQMNINLEINALAFQPKTHHLLIGNEDGVWVFNTSNQKFINHYNKEMNGLSNNLIEGIVPIDEQNLFVTTQYGLNLLHLTNGTNQSFYEKDGLSQNEFNRFSVHAGSNHRYYFGGTNGISIASPDDVIKKIENRSIAISRFYRYDFKLGRELSQVDVQNDSFTIEPNDPYFGFDFMYPDYSEPRLNQFQTWLEGEDTRYETGWQNASSQHQIRFGRLLKGRYILHLRALANSDHEKKVFINIKAHFYQSPWFVPMMTFILLLLGGGSAFSYQNKKKNEEIEKQKVDQKFKDLEAAALRAQMNPHFIFNCLNSIQQFISKNDADSASRYLANFSRLVRLALHSSVDGRHSLQDEIEMLENYLGLERLRFGDKFNFEIDVDPHLEQDEIYFPPLLIQPFVENALVHGINNKTQGGKIIISFLQKENALHVSVFDNGSGISSSNRSLNVSGHKSVGMTLTKHRLEILSNQDSFSMKPVIGNDGKATGTIVSIVIPIV